jgi:hypothetical protein
MSAGFSGILAAKRELNDGYTLTIQELTISRHLACC